MKDLIAPWTYKNPLCAEIGVEMFFVPDKDDNKGHMADYDQAKKICGQCIHRVECGEWGIRKERHGIWGGYTPKERKELRRKLKIVLIELPYEIEE